MWDQQIAELSLGNRKTLARCISLVENGAPGFEQLLQQLPPSPTPVIGVTGPPGAGKSTLVDGLVELLVKKGKKVAVICVDPSSPFHLGALLGDRIRMSEWYNHPDVYIRSLASRGSLGGLHPRIIEITDLVKAAGFDFVIIETVGVGQSEVEIAGLSDLTLVVLVPEAGDDVQAMKAGLMEIADIFVVNKADRPGADEFIRHLRLMLMPAQQDQAERAPVVSTVAAQKKGIEELLDKTLACLSSTGNRANHVRLLAEKAWHLLREKHMKGYNKSELMAKIEAAGKDFNLYRFVEEQSQ